MGRVGFGASSDEEGRDPLGRLTAPETPDNGPKARRAWRSGNPGAVAAEALKGVSKPVGPTGDNEPEDVGKIEALVADAGTHDVNKTDGPTGYFGQTLDQGIKAFQQAKGLKVDGLVNPGGPTETALKANTQANLAKSGVAAPAPKPAPKPKSPAAQAFRPAQSRPKGGLKNFLEPGAPEAAPQAASPAPPRGPSMDERGNWYDANGTPIAPPQRDPNILEAQATDGFKAEGQVEETSPDRFSRPDENVWRGDNKDMAEALDLDPDLVAADDPAAAEALAGIASYRFLDKDRKRSVLEAVQRLDQRGDRQLAFKLRAVAGEIDGGLRPEWNPATMSDEQLNQAITRNERWKDHLDRLSSLPGGTGSTAFLKLYGLAFEESVNRMRDEQSRRKR